MMTKIESLGSSLQGCDFGLSVGQLFLLKVSLPLQFFLFMKSVFDKKDTAELIERINKLTPGAQPLWGKMNASQMLAHCNVTYELVYEDKHPKPKGFKKFLLKTFIKNLIVSEKPYKRSSQTAPEFIIKDDRNFEAEKKRLIDYIHKTQELGASYFDGKESHSFGPLSKTEWNNLFFKHLDHHLKQFGV